VRAVNDYLASVIFGIVEGLTEFLPISSTAHLRLAQDLCGKNLQDPYWKMYAVVIQLGAILAVLVYFRQRIIKFLQSFPKGANGDRTLFTHPVTLTLIAFVATAGPAWILKKKVIDKNLENLWVMGAALLIGGVVMWAVDAIFTKPRTLDVEKMSLPQAIWVGLVQILSAVFPGTSRSMSTIAAGQSSGLSRATALEFSFYLSIPTMIAATGKELWDTLKEARQGASHAVADATSALATAAPMQMTGERWGVLLVGAVISFLVAWAVIAWFMAWVRNRGFTPFALYRIIVGIAVLVYANHARA
jgi:undecaprenyl-diphosphatase